jgi:hypothetical protein
MTDALRGFSQFLQENSGISAILNLATNTSFHTLSNSLFTLILSFEVIWSELLEKSVNKNNYK